MNKNTFSRSYTSNSRQISKLGSVTEDCRGFESSLLGRYYGLLIRI